MTYAQKILYSISFPFFCLVLLFYLLIPNPLLAQITENVTVSANVDSPDPGGGAEEKYIRIPKTSVQFSGEAYPLATVSVLKNGSVVGSIQANLTGLFSITLEEKYNGAILYSLYARDIAGVRSLLINYPLAVSVGYLTHISGIRFPPTVTLDKVEVKKGDYLSATGYALPQKELQAVIEDKNKKPTAFTLTSRNTGRYNITFPITNLLKGNYSLHLKYIDDNRKSILVNFIIADTNILSRDVSLNIPGDCNVDGRINLVDFSVLAFWYKKPNPPKCVDTNKDGIVNLTDFSILAYYWTG